MALEPKQRERLARFLTIAAQTAHDGEALNALRQAVKLCVAAKLSLPEALEARVVTKPDPEREKAVALAGYERGWREGEATEGAQPRRGRQILMQTRVR